MKQELQFYIQNFYGKCNKEKCTCLKFGYWLGSGCLHWNPVQAKTFDELKEQYGRVLLHKRLDIKR